MSEILPKSYVVELVYNPLIPGVIGTCVRVDSGLHHSDNGTFNLETMIKELQATGTDTTGLEPDQVREYWYNQQISTASGGEYS